MEIINPEKLLVKIAAILENVGIKYFVTGGFAVSVWGRPRATFDIDIVVQLFEAQVAALAKALREVSKIVYIEESSAVRAIRNKGEFNFIDTASGIKVDFWVNKGDEAGLLHLKRRRKKIIDGQTIYFISPEDLILSKLIWYQKSDSTRQLEDIESVLKISGAKLNQQYLRYWIGRIGVQKIWNKLMKK